MACGPGVWFSLTVREVLGLNPGPLQFLHEEDPKLDYVIRYVINITIAESWQAYQGPGQIKLEIVASPIWPFGGEWKDG